jgi:dTDP-glucose pyrophosphorylase
MKEQTLFRKIEASASLLKALKKMDAIDKKLLLVFTNDNFLGVLSIGDIQRAIINNTPLDTSISKIMRKVFLFVSPEDNTETIKQKMLQHRTECMPVIDSAGLLKDVIFWEEMFQETRKHLIKKFKLPVVIMAGGQGTRLRPLTHVLPKPLIPINDRTIIEHIMDRFVEIGCEDFIISLNYKADFIKDYITHYIPKKYNISFIQEEKPLGTGGSLFFLKDLIKSTFFVSNCDIIIDQDLSDILDFHFDNKNDLTMVAALKHFNIPYGTIETGEKGKLIRITEKPDITYKVNSGLYILEPHLLNLVSDNIHLNFPDFIEQISLSGKNIGVFPVSENSWTDVGDWKEYLRISHIGYDESTPHR